MVARSWSLEESKESFRKKNRLHFCCLLLVGCMEGSLACQDVPIGSFKGSSICWANDQGLLLLARCLVDDQDVSLLFRHVKGIYA